MGKVFDWLAAAKKQADVILSKNGRIKREQCNTFAQSTWDAFERGYMAKAENDKEMATFLMELHDRLKEGAHISSSWGDTYYIMWNDTECVGDVMRRLLGLPKRKKGEL